jgi:hypothetical protein
VELREIDVRFESGEELLGAYWGYLNGGGLVIGDDGFEVGEELSLSVSIDPSDATYCLHGRVVKCQPEGRQAVIAFHPGEPHDMLLSEALADTTHVAPRRFRRFEVDEPVRVICGGAEEWVHARLSNLSREGCCFELEEPVGFPVDSEVLIRHGLVQVRGAVVWARHVERGVRLTVTQALPLLTALFGDDIE